MNIVLFLVVGLLAGWVGNVLMRGHGVGVFGDILVGVIGAFVGGLIATASGIDGYGFWGLLATAVFGSVIFLFIVRLVSGSFSSRPQL